MLILEKLVTILSVLTVILVGSFVAFFTIVPKKSGMPDEAINSQLALNTWVEQRLNRASGAGPVLQVIPERELQRVLRERALKSNDPAKRAEATRPVDKKQLAEKTKKAQFDNYVEEDGKTIPDDEAVPGIPWLRAQQGVRYYRPKKVPTILYEKVQHFQDAYDSARQGGGEFLETDHGAAYRINWVKPKSHLSSVVGLKPGDKLLSVNGHKIGNSFTAARQLYDQLKNEKRFAVKVLRDGSPTVLSFTIK